MPAAESAALTAPRNSGQTPAATARQKPPAPRDRRGSQPPPVPGLAVVLPLLALAGLLAAWIANGGPLFYYDTLGYLAVGDRILAAAGQVLAEAEPARLPGQLIAPLLAAPAFAQGTAAPEAGQAAQTPGADPGAGAAPETPAAAQAAAQSGAAADGRTGAGIAGNAAGGGGAVVGSRSALYGLILGLAARLDGYLGGLGGAVLANALIIAAAFGLVARAGARAGAFAAPALPLAAAALIAASAGSLPFYVAYLMPDILAPVLILAFATLAGFGWAMGRGGVALALSLALAAVLSHPSHLLMAALLAPLAALAAPLPFRRRLGLLALIVLPVLGLGLAERLVFGLAVERLEKRAVIYEPFLTARLMDDGPGFDWLAAHCPRPDSGSVAGGSARSAGGSAAPDPDPALAFPASCALYASLARPGDLAGRRDAPVILFARDAEYGSYRLLDEPTRRAIAAEQLGLARTVLADRPLAVLGAFGRDVATQLGMTSVAMTIPTPEMVADLGPGLAWRGYDPLAKGAMRLAAAGLGPGAPWQGALDRAQGALSLASLAGIAWLLLVRPRSGAPLPRGLAAFAWMVLAGILANAVICGGISEPADRYGARVAFLLPALWALLALRRWPGPRWPDSGESRPDSRPEPRSAG